VAYPFPAGVEPVEPPGEPPVKPPGEPPGEPPCLKDMVVEAVEVPAADGLVIRGDLYLPSTGGEPSPGVILLHMLNSNRRAWRDFPWTLAGECDVVLAVDLRGHGETSGQNDWVKARDDMQLVIDYLGSRPEVQDGNIALVGASVGANLALAAGAGSDAVRTVVLLSPGIDYAGIKSLEALALYAERPLLMFASEEDTYAADSSRTLDEYAQGEHRLVLFQGAGHGTDMFANEPGLHVQIMDWLETYLK
jgi:pimeloyl-ACP methyl ester carboxylesterase